MDSIQILLLLAIGAQTTYLTVKAIQPAKIARDSILLDTNVLIDGRILPIARSGLVTAPLIVPTSVVRELQFMADRADHDKRERARFGLEMIERLQALDTVDLRVVDDGIVDHHGVDEQLIKLAQRWRAKLCTIDYNLNKSARVQAVHVININELAHALRVTYLPGEELEVKLIQTGQEAHQAVGYLDDGTMVVVDQAKSLIGKLVRVEATRVLQTAAGKMLFAKTHGTSRVRTTPSSRRSFEKSEHPVAEKRHTKKSQASVTVSRHTGRTTEDTVIHLANRSK